MKRKELTDKEREYPTPQEDGPVTEYKDGHMLFGTHKERVERWKEWNLHRIPKGH